MSQILTLVEFYLTRLELTLARPADAPKARDGALSVDYDAARNNDNPDIYKLILHVKWEPKIKDGCPQEPQLESVIVGIFQFPSDMEEDKRNWLLRYNGGMILYGILRGQVAIFTGSFSTGKFMLPSFDMKEAILSIEKKKAVARVKMPEKQETRIAAKPNEKSKVIARRSKSKSK